MKVLPEGRVFVVTATNNDDTFVRHVTTTREKALVLLEADGYVLKEYAHGPCYWWNPETRYVVDIEEFEVQA